MKETGKQKPIRIDRTPKMKKKTSSMRVQEKMLISISNAPVKQAIMPMIERAANEMTPVLVIFCSMFCSFIIVSLVFIIQLIDLQSGYCFIQIHRSNSVLIH